MNKYQQYNVQWRLLSELFLKSLNSSNSKQCCLCAAFSLVAFESSYHWPNKSKNRQTAQQQLNHKCRFFAQNETHLGGSLRWCLFFFFFSLAQSLFIIAAGTSPHKKYPAIQFITLYICVYWTLINAFTFLECRLSHAILDVRRKSICCS